MMRKTIKTKINSRKKYFFVVFFVLFRCSNSSDFGRRDKRNSGAARGRRRSAWRSTSAKYWSEAPTGKIQRQASRRRCRGSQKMLLHPHLRARPRNVFLFLKTGRNRWRPDKPRPNFLPRELLKFALRKPFWLACGGGSDSCGDIHCRPWILQPEEE